MAILEELCSGCPCWEGAGFLARLPWLLPLTSLSLLWPLGWHQGPHLVVQSQDEEERRHQELLQKKKEEEQERLRKVAEAKRLAEQREQERQLAEQREQERRKEQERLQAER